MTAIIAFLALIGALTGLARASGTKRMNRESFSKIALIVWAPILLLVILDAMKLDGQIDIELKQTVLWLLLWLLLTSYPLFTRVAWRLNDAGKGKAWGYIALIPYINALVFLYLCLVPAAKIKDSSE